jgi:hypothetical protein
MLAVNFVWLEASVLAFVAGFSLVSAASVFRSRNRDSKIDGPVRYEDKDGVASEDSQKAYSVKSQKVILTLLTAAGFLVALAQAVLATIFHWIAITETWIDFTVWVGIRPVLLCSLFHIVLSTLSAHRVDMLDSRF